MSEKSPLVCEERKRVDSVWRRGLPLWRNVTVVLSVSLTGEWCEFLFGLSLLVSSANAKLGSRFARPLPPIA